jgi:hypothetical protein
MVYSGSAGFPCGLSSWRLDFSTFFPNRQPPLLLVFVFRSNYIPPTMPRDGALTLADVRQPVLAVVCEPCGRRGRYDVERLMRQYGWDAKLTDLLTELVANCPKRVGRVSMTGSGRFMRN